MRVLVTGLNGFTGKYVKTELENRGHQVLALSCRLTDTSKLAQEIKHLNPQAVIHLAAIAFIKHANTADFYQTNVIGSYHLLNALHLYASQVESILLASSANVYGNSEHSPIHETIVTHPINDYAVSKLAMENMANLWQTKLPIFITRPFNYTGLGQANHFLIPKIVTHFKNKEKIIELGNLDVWREFGDVRTVAQIYVKLLEKKPLGKTINVCTEQAISLREAINLASEITQHKIEIKINPHLIRENELRLLIGSNGLLKKIIGHWDTIPFKDTLKWMLES